MKRTVIILLALVMTLSIGGAFAFAAERDIGSDNTGEIKQLMLGLDYDLYILTSQNYEGEAVNPDETGILLYAADGYGIVDMDGFEAPVILQFDFDSMTIDVEGETASFSVEENKLTLTDSDGWTVVFSKYEPGLQRYVVSKLLGMEDQ